MEYYKYNRTYHLPWSLGSTSDDKFLDNTQAFEGKIIVLTEKMDGENTNMYPDRIHARSIDSKDHDSRHWVKGLWGQIKTQIPEGWRICGENMYAKHSLYYDNLESYFLVFSIWDENNMCLSFYDTIKICDMLGLTMVPIMKIMLYDEKVLKEIADELDITKHEGYVIRNIESFHYDDFSDNVAKWVRPKHVTSSQHWMFEKITPNLLKK
jgi:RNA ligase